MTAADTVDGANSSAAGDGTVELQLDLPEDLLHLMPPGTPEAALPEHYRQVVLGRAPDLPVQQQQAAIDQLLHARALLDATGVELFGLLVGPYDDGWAWWQLAVALPPLPADDRLDPVGLLHRTVGRRFGSMAPGEPPTAVVEQGRTPLGWSVGVRTTVPGPELDGQPSASGAVFVLTPVPQLGRALVISATCLDPAHLDGLSSLVTLVAARARLVPREA